MRLPRLLPAVLAALVLTAGCGDTDTAEPESDLAVDDAGSTSGCLDTDWWSTDDAQFVADCKDLATGSQEDRSAFAWMVFARINQPVEFPSSAEPGAPLDTFSVWETWASDGPSTFPDAVTGTPTGPPTARPHAEISNTVKGMIPASGEEKTRNAASYQYIVDNGFYLRSNVEARLGSDDPVIDFPVGAIETKANWTTDLSETMYRAVSSSRDTVGLNGIHVMVKVAPTPEDPNDPSWFWATFEPIDNPGRDHAMQFVTYPDVLPFDRAMGILAQAGLEGGPWRNYRLNGTQIAFVTPEGEDVILGNTTMENAFAVPRDPDPTTWTAWQSSCHSCHFQASGTRDALLDMFPGCSDLRDDVSYPVGRQELFNGFQPTDFVWALPFHAVERNIGESPSECPNSRSTNPTAAARGAGLSPHQGLPAAVLHAR